MQHILKQTDPRRPIIQVHRIYQSNFNCESSRLNAYNIAKKHENAFCYIKDLHGCKKVILSLLSTMMVIGLILHNYLRYNLPIANDPIQPETQTK